MRGKPLGKPLPPQAAHKAAWAQQVQQSQAVIQEKQPQKQQQ